MVTQEALQDLEILSEREYVSRYDPLPNPSSSLYLTITKLKNADGSENHMISGMRVEFHKAHDENHPLAAYHIDPNKKLPDDPDPKQADQQQQVGMIRNLTICADEVVIYGELYLPETNVRVFARNLTFKDLDGDPGRINTSPLHFTSEKAAQRPDGSGMNGNQGRNAGSIEVYSANFQVDHPFKNRFYLRGGKGQDAGEGTDGVSGNTLQYNIDYFDGATYGVLGYTFDPPAVYFHLENCIWGPHGATGDTWNLGCNTWPKDGTDAMQPGKPGSGGNGGSFTGVFPAHALDTLSLEKRLPRAGVQVEIAQRLAGEVKLRGADFYQKYGRAILMDREGQRDRFFAEVHCIAALLTQLKEAFTAIQQMAGSAESSLAGQLSEMIQLTNAGLVKTDHFLEGRIPYDPSKAALIKVNAQQISLLTELAFQKVGELANSLNAASGCIDISGNVAGQKAQDRIGGTQGSPVTSAKYDIRCYSDPVGKLHRWWCTRKETHTTKNGASYPAPDEDRRVGEDGTSKIATNEDFGNAWLHPSLLQSFLLYIRDAYLVSPAEIHQWAPVLRDYAAGLQSLPDAAEFGEILARSGASYSESFNQQSLTEVLALLHRIDSQLDFFGHPAGWTPLFSLPVCLHMYEEEVNQGLKTLVLSKWIQQKAEQAKEASIIAIQSIDSLNKKTKNALEQIKDETGNLNKLKAQAAGLENQITELSIRMANKRTELLNKAENQATEAAWINLGTSVLSGICQVIPYGQPALGALGSAGKVIADNAIQGNDPIKNVGPMTSLLGQVIQANLDQQAAQILEAAKKSKETESAEEKSAKATAARLTQAGSAIGPALTGIADSVVGLNVPQEEVDARLNRLEAENPEFQELVHDLQALNVQKVEFFQKLIDSIQTLSSAHAQVTSNLLTVNALESQRNSNLAVLDHEALLYIKKMDQDARFALIKYLYYLARCYEYAVLEPISVDYKLDAIFDKIVPLLSGDDIERSVITLTEMLAPLFQNELHKLGDRLKTNFRPEYTETIQIELSSDQTPEIIAQLNATGEAIINLRDLNCILPKYEKVKIEDIDIDATQLVFDTDERPLPKSGTVELTLEPMGEGTIRAGNRLYVVRHPTSASSTTAVQNSPQIWGMTYSFASKTKKGKKIRPSQASLDLLDSLMGNTNQIIHEKLANPAAWTDFRVRFTRKVLAPGLKSVILNLSLNWSKADESYCVLDVRMGGQEAPLLQCTPADTNGHGNGQGALYRIFVKDSPVRLVAPPRYGKKIFSHWEVIDNTDTMVPREVYEPRLEIKKIHYNMLVFCFYTDQADTEAVIYKAPNQVHALLATQFPSMPGQTDLPGFMESKDFQRFVAKLPQLLSEQKKNQQHGWSSVIANKPGGIPIGYLPPDAEFAVLKEQQEADGVMWQKVAYRGLVGWVSAVEGSPEDGK